MKTEDTYYLDYNLYLGLTHWLTTYLTWRNGNMRYLKLYCLSHDDTDDTVSGIAI